jgi:hypothetical protein
LSGTEEKKGKKRKTKKPAEVEAPVVTAASESDLNAAKIVLTARTE